MDNAPADAEMRDIVIALGLQTYGVRQITALGHRERRIELLRYWSSPLPHCSRYCTLAMEALSLEDTIASDTHSEFLRSAVRLELLSTL